MSAIMFHTQENRGKNLLSPILCNSDDAWLGSGYYFWYDEDDAVKWGFDFKKRTGSFKIYSANVDKTYVLDTVFNEKGYLFFKKVLDKVTKKYAKLGTVLTVKELFKYLRSKNILNEFTGVQFSDIPLGRSNIILKSRKVNVKYGNNHLNYIRRVQLVAYTLDIISNFELHEEIEC